MVFSATWHMAHPEECVRVGLHRMAARPSFSIIAVPHMVLYDCPSSCPIAEHMLVPALLNRREKRFYYVFLYPNRRKKTNALFDMDKVKRWLCVPYSALRQRSNRFPDWKLMLAPTGFGSIRRLGPCLLICLQPKIGSF